MNQPQPINGVRGFWNRGAPLVVLSGFAGIDDVEELEDAIRDIANMVIAQSEADPEAAREADAEVQRAQDAALAQWQQQQQSSVPPRPVGVPSPARPSL